MKEIDEIKSDEKVVMTAILIRAFKMAGCDPACHCCDKELKAGDIFTLAEVKSISNVRNVRSEPETNDEMLCSNCNPAKLIRKRQRLQNERITYHARQGGGFTRPHKA